MLRKWHILAISVIVVSAITVVSIDAQEDYSIPQWVKNTALWWGQGDISDADYISGINFLIDQKILRVSSSQDSGDMQVLEKDVLRLSKENQELKNDVEYWKNKYHSLTSNSDSDTKSNTYTPHFDNLHALDKEFSAGPFRFHVSQAGTEWFEEDGESVELFTVYLDAKNARGSTVQYVPTTISLTTSDGYALQHKYTNGLKVNTGVPSGGKISGFYTFEKPSSTYGNFKLFIEVAVYEDSATSYNWHYSGETEFDMPWR